MKNRAFFFGILFGTALFVYLISSFLIATFNITLWENYHRFFAVLAYLFLVTAALDRTPTKKVNRSEAVEQPSGQIDAKLEQKELEQSSTV